MTGEALRGATGAQVEAQAKINLRLKILAREASGYHQLETLFLRLALADTVRVRRSSTHTLDVSGVAPGATLGPTERNLAWRAAVAYAGAGGWKGGFAIELEKRIPVGGGLGGGSADAGAVLRIMDALAPSPLGEPALLDLAASLGADVPFLTSGHVYALAWGRGERLLALRTPEMRQVLLVIPDFGVDTAAAYGWLAEWRAAERRAPEAGPLLSPASLSDWDAIAALAVNDFQPAVAARHPAILGLVEGLRNMGCVPTLMSGSGSTVFGVCPVSPPVGWRVGLEPAGTVRGVTTYSAARVEPVRRLD